MLLLRCLHGTFVLALVVPLLLLLAQFVSLVLLQPSRFLQHTKSMHLQELTSQGRFGFLLEGIARQGLMLRVVCVHPIGMFFH